MRSLGGGVVERECCEALSDCGIRCQGVVKEVTLA
jgi:hypothetical protein